MTLTEQNEKILNDYIDAITGDTQDVARVQRYLHDNIVCEDRCLGERYEGVDQVLKFFKYWFDCTRMKGRIVNMIVQDNIYALVSRASGEYVKEMPGFGPASGQKYDFPVVSIGLLENGKIMATYQNGDFQRF